MRLVVSMIFGISAPDYIIHVFDYLHTVVASGTKNNNVRKLKNMY